MTPGVKSPLYRQYAKRIFLEALVLISLVSPINTFGTKYTWSGGTSGTWETASNWTPKIPSNTSTDALNFSKGATFKTIDFSTNKVMDSLSFDTSTGAYALSTANGSTLTLGGGGITVTGSNGVSFSGGTINLTGAQPWNATSSNLTFSNTETLAFTGGSTVTIGGSNSTYNVLGNYYETGGSGAITINSPGSTVTMTGTTALTGALALQAGNLVLTNSFPTSGTFNFSGGTLTNAGGGFYVGTSNFSGNIALASTNANSISFGNVALAGNTTLNVSGLQSSGNVYFNSPITGSGSLTLTNGGITGPNATITMYGNNTFTGGLTINIPGTTLFATSAQFAGTGTLSLLGGTLSSGSWPTITNNIVLNSGSNGFAFTGGSTFTLAGTSLTLGTAAQTLSIDAGNTVVVNSTISGGGGGLTVNGGGTMTIAGTTANTFTGGLTITNATVNLQKTAGTNAIGGGTITINSGGTLLLSNANQIPNASNMVLGGGTFNTNGQNEALGTLTLSANSTIDMGSGASVINYANSSGTSWLSGQALTIANWTGSLTGGGADQLIFGTSATGLTASQISQIYFLNPTGLSAGTYGAKILGSGEIVPNTFVAAEAKVYIIGWILGITAVAWEIRRRIPL